MAERLTRRRRKFRGLDEAKLWDRIDKIYRDDIANRTQDIDARLQRYAKLRMISHHSRVPWEGASDVATTDIAEQSWHSQDNLVNATLNSRPVGVAKAIQKENRSQEDLISRLRDYQIFEEDDGEDTIQEMARAFVDDGEYVVYQPWVREFREVTQVKSVGSGIPEEMFAMDFFQAIISREYNEAEIVNQSKDGWDYTVRTLDDQDRTLKISFYTDDLDNVEFVVKENVKVFDGPKWILYDYEDVLWPTRAQNLQPKSASNPTGSSHLILRDYPTVEEIERLSKGRDGRKPFYDRIKSEDVTALQTHGMLDIDRPLKKQKDLSRGKQDDQTGKSAFDRKHGHLTRLIFFDTFDIDGDGIAEDVVYWALVEPRIILKVELLTEFFPFETPKRPVVRREHLPGGIGVPEMLESLHDADKRITDQVIDAGDIAIMKPIFYRPSSTMKAEVIRYRPGEMYPLGNPSQDVREMDVNTNGLAFGLNMKALFKQDRDRLSTQGDVQLGGVPPGRSSALRTVGGLQLLAAQGEARPERILRRFLSGVVELVAMGHEMNQTMLPSNKRIRIVGARAENEDPYINIEGPNKIAGMFDFTFTANVFNSNKTALQQAIEKYSAVGVNALTIQMGIAQPDDVYRLVTDYSKSLGLDPDNYASEPFPGARLRRITADQAINIILQNRKPVGIPAEGAEQHLASFQSILQALQDPNEVAIMSKSLGMNEPIIFTAVQLELLREYLNNLQQVLQAEQQAALQAQAANQFGQGQQLNQGGRPTEQAPPNPNNNPQISGAGELLDETLPTAGGGAVQ